MTREMIRTRFAYGNWWIGNEEEDEDEDDEEAKEEEEKTIFQCSILRSNAVTRNWSTFPFKCSSDRVFARLFDDGKVASAPASFLFFISQWTTKFLDFNDDNDFFLFLFIQSSAARWDEMNEWRKATNKGKEVLLFKDFDSLMTNVMRCARWNDGTVSEEKELAEKNARSSANWTNAVTNFLSLFLDGEELFV